MSRLTETQKIELENVIDHYGMARVLEMCAEIAVEKAMHIRSNWQDEKTAKCWDKAAQAAEKAANVAADYLGRH